MAKRKSDDQVAILFAPGAQQLANPLLGCMGVYEDIDEAKKEVKRTKGQMLLTTYYKEEKNGDQSKNN